MQYTCARNCVRKLCSSPACNPIKLIVKVATCRRLDKTGPEGSRTDARDDESDANAPPRSTRRGSTVIRSRVEKGGHGGLRSRRIKREKDGKG